MLNNDGPNCQKRSGQLSAASQMEVWDMWGTTLSSHRPARTSMSMAVSMDAFHARSSPSHRPPYAVSPSPPPLFTSRQLQSTTIKSSCLASVLAGPTRTLNQLEPISHQPQQRHSGQPSTNSGNFDMQPQRSESSAISSVHSLPSSFSDENAYSTASIHPLLSGLTGDGDLQTQYFIQATDSFSSSVFPSSLYAYRYSTTSHSGDDTSFELPPRVRRKLDSDESESVDIKKPWRPWEDEGAVDAEQIDEKEEVGCDYYHKGKGKEKKREGDKGLDNVPKAAKRSARNHKEHKARRKFNLPNTFTFRSTAPESDPSFQRASERYNLVPEHIPSPSQGVALNWDPDDTIRWRQYSGPQRKGKSDSIPCVEVGSRHATTAPKSRRNNRNAGRRISNAGQNQERVMKLEAPTVGSTKRQKLSAFEWKQGAASEGEMGNTTCTGMQDEEVDIIYGELAYPTSAEYGLCSSAPSNITLIRGDLDLSVPRVDFTG